MAKTDPTLGAFPATEHKQDGDALESSGLTKMEYFAAKAMEGILSNSTTKLDPLPLARTAVSMAKALVQVLNE